MKARSVRLVALLTAVSLLPVSTLAAPVEDGQNEFGRFKTAPPQQYIPLTRPKYLAAKNAQLADDQMIVGLKVGDDVRCYPLRLMTYHHVVNDEIGGQKLAVTYCIMANTAVTYRLEEVDKGLWAAGLLGGVLVLGRVGGEDLWPQIRHVPVPLNPQSPPLTLGPPCVIAPFSRWRAAYPQTKVLAPEPKFDLYYTAFDRRPKGYRRNPMMTATMVHYDGRLSLNDEVLGVAAGDQARAYPLDWLKAHQRVEETVGERKTVVLWDEKLDAPRVEEPFEGLCTRAYWYAWSSFYPRTEIAGQPSSSAGQSVKQERRAGNGSR
jgi:hypothetical protein